MPKSEGDMQEGYEPEGESIANTIPHDDGENEHLNDSVDEAPSIKRPEKGKLSGKMKMITVALGVTGLLVILVFGAQYLHLISGDADRAMISSAALTNVESNVSKPTTPVNISESDEHGKANLSNQANPVLVGGALNEDVFSQDQSSSGLAKSPLSEGVDASQGEDTSLNDGRVIAALNSAVDQLNALTLRVRALENTGENKGMMQVFKKISELQLGLSKINKKITLLKKPAHTTKRPAHHKHRAKSQRHKKFKSTDIISKSMAIPAHPLVSIRYLVMASVPGTAWIYKTTIKHGKTVAVGDAIKIREGDTLRGFGKIQSIDATGKIITASGIVPSRSMM